MADQVIPFNIPGPNTSVEQKLDFLIQLSVNTAKEVSAIKATVEGLQARVTAVETDVGSAQNEIKHLKNTVNRLEQASRNLTIRVLGIPQVEGENVARVAYDRVLKPILAKAKDLNKINAIPQLATLISEAYRARPRHSDDASMFSDRPSYPPHIIVKLSSSQYKTVLFNTKKDGLPSPTEAEKAAGIKRLAVVEDLTSTTFTTLAFHSLCRVPLVYPGTLRPAPGVPCLCPHPGLHLVFPPLQDPVHHIPKYVMVFFTILFF